MFDVCVGDLAGLPDLAGPQGVRDSARRALHHPWERWRTLGRVCRRARPALPQTLHHVSQPGRHGGGPVEPGPEGTFVVSEHSGVHGNRTNGAGERPLRRQRDSVVVNTAATVAINQVRRVWSQTGFCPVWQFLEAVEKWTCQPKFLGSFLFFSQNSTFIKHLHRAACWQVQSHRGSVSAQTEHFPECVLRCEVTSTSSYYANWKSSKTFRFCVRSVYVSLLCLCTIGKLFKGGNFTDNNNLVCSAEVKFFFIHQSWS